MWQSRHLALIHPSLNVPVWALLLNSFIISIVGILYIVSTTAFNAFIGSAAITSQVSIALPLLLLILRKRRGRFLPSDREFKLPNMAGYMVNAVSVSWGIILLIFLCLPVSFPVTGGNMSESCETHRLLILC